MRNPFKQTLPGITYSPEPSQVESDPDSYVKPNAIELGDEYYPDTLVPAFRGDVGNIDQTMRPAYAGQDKREIVYQPGPLPEYSFLAPAPGSTDLIAPRDSGSVPGTAYENIMAGPVTGFALDQYQEGNRQALLSTPPGAHGPVVGGDDYSNIVTQATWQQAFAEYSNAASDQAIVRAI